MEILAIEVFGGELCLGLVFVDVTVARVFGDVIFGDAKFRRFINF